MDSAQAQIFIEQLIGKKVDGWLLHDVHGYGKSAVVMAGATPDARAAIKVFHPELVERFGRQTQLERIRRETSLIGATHPNVVEILGGGECPQTGLLYVAMEELPWKNLKERLSVLPEELYWSAIEQIAAAAKFLEDRGLAHRDIKPENVAISDDFRNLKLLDLGVIRPFGVAGLTDLDARVFIGTLRYSSPEFLRREEMDSEEGWRALSFYQVGAVLHDILMRKELFEEHSEPFARLVEAVQSVNPDVHGADLELVRLCKNCLVKDPAVRLQLVDWESFSQRRSQDDREELFRKIRERQAYYAQVDDSTYAGLSAEESRLLKVKLQLASSSLDYKLGRLLTSLKCFPLHSITPSIEIEQGKCASQISCAPDGSLGISEEIVIHADLSMIDRNLDRPIYRLTCTATLGGDLVRNGDEIGMGALEDVTIDKPIEEWLLQVLKEVYDLLERKNLTV